MSKKILLLSFLFVGCEIDNTPCVVDSDAVYKQTMQCMGMFAEPPEIKYIDFNTLGLGKGWGVYHVASKTIMVNIGDMGPTFEHSCSTQSQTINHEGIHHILHENNLGDTSLNHSSPFFKLCGAGVNYDTP